MSNFRASCHGFDRCPTFKHLSLQFATTAYMCCHAQPCFRFSSRRACMYSRSACNRLVLIDKNNIIAARGGTAFPICSIFWVLLPMKIKSLGKVWREANSRTSYPLVPLGKYTFLLFPPHLMVPEILEPSRGTLGHGKRYCAATS